MDHNTKLPRARRSCQWRVSSQFSEPSLLLISLPVSFYCPPSSYSLSPLSLSSSSSVAVYQTRMLTHSSRESAGVIGRSQTPSFPYFGDFRPANASEPGHKICIVSTTSAGLEQILRWIFYHKFIGITHFFLFVEGEAASPDTSQVLASIPGVELIYRSQELEEQQANSCIWSESWLSSFFYKPCNYELFVKQTLNMETSIVMAREAGMDWIIHVDTDELIHPAGSQEYSVQQLLSHVPQDVDMVILTNYEAAVERDNIKEPFSEVALFKKNFDHLSEDIYFGNYEEASLGNPNYFLTYANGKSAARIQDHLRPNGAHRWHNCEKIPNEIKLDEAAILHYTYSKFSDLTSRHDRCGCKPTKDDVQRCFMLEFDQNAFIIASTTTEKELLHWYREHIVWTDKELKLKLLKQGMLTHIHAPMVIIQGLRESGVFSSLVASAQVKFLASSKSTDTSRNTEEKVTYSRKKKVGKEVLDSEMSGRKILEIVETSSSAIPPKSSPSLHGADISV